ncbi:MAG: hypothetical protein HC855_12100 [Rhizobiales bacterium]|nr:hypothetical protein [Hyphomicrobiales bacterium]
MSASIAATNLQEPVPVVRFLNTIRTASPFWWRAALAGAAICAMFFTAGFIDERTINGVNVWDKPFKFMLSFTVHVLTFGWAFALMSEAERGSRVNRAMSYAFVIFFALEVAYMAWRASRGEASHFNVSTQFAAVAYKVMGLLAVGLTAITAWFGWRLLRTETGLHARAAGIGLMLGAVLGTIAGAYLGSQPGHWVGGAATDADGLAFFRWSTTGGDLRVAHFAGLHAMQFVPLAAWLRPRASTIWLSALAITVVTAAIFIQAIMGVPLFAV